VPSYERLKHVNCGMTAVRDITRVYQEHVGMRPQPRRPVMVITEDIMMLKEQFHLHFGSTWEKMTERSRTSHFAARTVDIRDTGTYKFLAAWDKLPGYVSKTVAKGNLHHSLSESEIAEEAEVDSGQQVGDDDDSGLEPGSVSVNSSLDNAVRSWERSHEGKEGKFSDDQRAVCKELMSSCFERASVLHEKRAESADAAARKDLEEQEVLAEKIATRQRAQDAVDAAYAKKTWSVRSIHGERVARGTDQREFLVHWTGSMQFDRSWEPESNVAGCDTAIAEFRERSAQASQRASKRKKNT
jgi:hypothetical protein